MTNQTLPQSYREHNRAVAEAAGVPSHAMRGIARATRYHHERIRSISKSEHGNHWGLVVELYEGSMTTFIWTIGPRGGAREHNSR